MLGLKDMNNGIPVASFTSEDGTELSNQSHTSGWVLHDLNIAWILKNVKGVACIRYFKACEQGKPDIQAAFDAIFPNLPMVVNVKKYEHIYIALTKLYNELVS